jgi:cytosine/adenosine deaminase-related metal-dependent hydrolase
MATRNNAALANLYFPNGSLGEISPDGLADLIFVDYPSPTPVTADNLPWHVVFGLEPDMVTTTIVGGKVLMRDRKLTMLDEAQIAARARELARKVWKRYEDKFRT